MRSKDKITIVWMLCFVLATLGIMIYGLYSEVEFLPIAVIVTALLVLFSMFAFAMQR